MSKKQNTAIKQPRYRNAELTERRNLKMARSIHAYVRAILLNIMIGSNKLKLAPFLKVLQFGFVAIAILGT